MFCDNLPSAAPSVRWTESAARHYEYHDPLDVDHVIKLSTTPLKLLCTSRGFRAGTSTSELDRVAVSDQWTGNLRR